MDPTIIKDLNSSGNLALALYIFAALISAGGALIGVHFTITAIQERRRRGLDARIREIVKAESASQDRVGELIRAALKEARVEFRLEMKELLDDHARQEWDVLGKTVARVEGDAKAGLESLHSDTRRVLEQIGGLEKKIGKMWTRIGIAETNINILMGNKPLPKESDSEP